MKKALLIFTAVAVLMGSLSTIAFAADCDYEINYGQTLTVIVNSENGACVEFTPQKTATYILEAESDGLDTFCSLREKESDENILFADDHNGMDFRVEYEFEGGKTYCFDLGVYNEGTFEYNITLICGHSFEDGSCVICGGECAHATMDFLGFCPCGEIYLGEDIEAGDTVVHDNNTLGGESGWFRFVPEESGAYCFEAFINPDVYSNSGCHLYDENGEWIHYESAYDENTGFKLIFGFEEGKTYYFETQEFFEDAIYEIKLSRSTHITVDDSVHKLDYAEETDSTCKEHGYTAGLYCPVCDEYVFGHEEKELDWMHLDIDENDICDVCGEEIDYSDIFPDDDENDDDNNTDSDSSFPLYDWIMNLIRKVIDFILGLFGMNSIF